jgi:hypothetical protein
MMAGGSLEKQFTYVFELAQSLLCETQSACQQCRACQWVHHKTHPDLHYFISEEKTSIKVDDIRSITHLLAQSSHQGSYKMVVIAPAEAMSVSAQNALLKILEEPPPHSLLILLTQYYGLLLPTVRSRCQRVILPAEEMTELKMVSSLWDTLQELRLKKLTPFQACEQWQKVELRKVLEAMFFIVLKHPKAQVFLWHDEVNKIRTQVLYKLNPNPLMTLEYLFYQWVSLYDVG